MQQVFLNIINNAIDAVDKGGLIGISSYVKDEQFVRVAIKDNGSGIPKDKIKHIFEPFYTSDQCKGTGLGLHIIYNQIRQKLNGTITCKSEQGEGAIFMIEVPVNDYASLGNMIYLCKGNLCISLYFLNLFRIRPPCFYFKQ